jgi:hypothetical protein
LEERLFLPVDIMDRKNPDILIEKEALKGVLI